MTRSPQAPSPGWRRDALDAAISFAVAVVMFLIGVSTGQTVFGFMAGAMVLIGVGEALGGRHRRSSLFLIRAGRAGMVASLAYAIFALLFGGRGG